MAKSSYEVCKASISRYREKNREKLNEKMRENYPSYYKESRIVVLERQRRQKLFKRQAELFRNILIESD